MLFRKIENKIREHLQSSDDRILIVEGARQIGKSYIVRHIGEELYKNFIEINLAEDFEGPKLFQRAHTLEDFYLQLSIMAGENMGSKEDTLVFLDEIQTYPHLLTLLKFLRQDGKFHYIASGSLLGITLKQSTSIPLGSIAILDMYPLDFEEFLIANGIGKIVIDHIYKKFHEKEALEESLHNRIYDLFKKYLLVGGMPQAINSFLETTNIVRVRNIQSEISSLYGIDASKYDLEHRLKIQKLLRMIPSAMENKKKRIVFRDIEDKKGVR